MDILGVDDGFQVEIVQRGDHVQMDHLVHIVVHSHARRVGIAVVVENIENMRALVEKPQVLDLSLVVVIASSCIQGCEFRSAGPLETWGLSLIHI